MDQELSNQKREPASAECSIWVSIGIVVVCLAIIAAVVVAAVYATDSNPWRIR